LLSLVKPTDIIWGAVERVRRDVFALGPVAVKLAYCV
jgi:hypothetical protein